MAADTVFGEMLSAANRAKSMDYEIDEIISATGRLLCAHQPPDGLARSEWKAAADQLLRALDRLVEERADLIKAVGEIHERAERALARGC